jgi:hypothetical protein
MRRSVLPSTLVAGLLIGALPAVATPAGAATKPLIDRLISTSQASSLGFGKVANAAKSSHKTGAKNCGTGAEVVYIEKKHAVGFIDEIFTCKSATAAKAVLATFEKTYKPDDTFGSLTALGASAAGSEAAAPLYTVFWTRGSYVGFVAVDTDATTTKAQYEIHLHDPLTPALKATEEKAALMQNTNLA